MNQRRMARRVKEGTTLMGVIRKTSKVEDEECPSHGMFIRRDRRKERAW